MELDVVIRNAEVVRPGVGAEAIELGIKDGKVAGYYARGTAPSALQEIDATGKHVLPGVIDPHTHYAYFLPHDQLFAAETPAAAIGGVTTVISFSRSNGSYREVLDGWIRAGEENAYVDFSFHLGMLTEAQLDDIGWAVTEHGLTSFKFYMGYKAAAAQQLGMAGGFTAGLMWQGFRRIAEYPGAIACVHAENYELIERCYEDLKERSDAAAWAEGRPRFGEADAIDTVLRFAEAAGIPIYIPHMSAKEGLDPIAYYKARRPGVYAETLIAYLTHTVDSPAGLLVKVNPPVRTADHQEALWAAIADGRLDTVGSDNAPLTLGERKREGEDVWRLLPGFATSPFILPGLLSQGVNEGRLTLERVVELTSYNAARIFGLYPRKGTLAIGADADLVVVDLNLEREVSPALVKCRPDYTLYDGMRLRGWPVLTMVRGEVVARDFEVVGRRGHGQFLRRSAQPLPSAV
ncbi:MAG: amidohydrolase family protein [Chloroflexi bacterium]|nr:amidohydrolase family protein [Chloroflexota bacterium]